MERNISVIGLGYVGLPVAVAFGHIKPTIGFDINPDRINELKSYYDRTNEVDKKDLETTNVIYTSEISILAKADFHIIAVPTPVNDSHQPDLTPVIKASETVAKALKFGDIVVYESTVYPGVTEDICVPILEEISGLKNGVDFKVGYSPERINPGDKERTFTKIKKVVSGQDDETLDIVAQVYESVVHAGVFRASSIKVAEAAKVIENTQRDVNIALMNELALIFDRINLNTLEVIDAASSKWNFLPFKPGLVGGHCIGVDPYYLTHLAEKVGYLPQVILSGRRINDGLGSFIGQKTVKQMIHNGHAVKGSTVTILGLTFKENCPDIRNSKVIDVIYELKEFGIEIQVFDPYADKTDAFNEYGIKLVDWNELKPSEAIVVAVSHKYFDELLPSDFDEILVNNPVIVDVKGCIDTNFIEKMNKDILYWRL
ncbi:nucleotide sugar dehydrogenase [Acinetobacter pseudolwoffii]|uniref:nucleotide sugar dehydrogenase n=1 Tax=Acinetobacter pseudolwoffii TaxID=2053287 RepID=UPI00257857CF|nr:nucleotide sugar dehydrogenase [Acinetobacter pseudolwoffii]MDM1335739.1 nucleotide sugar dehydrogenase [Acinetobacter pseudolwoffii]